MTRPCTSRRRGPVLSRAFGFAGSDRVAKSSSGAGFSSSFVGRSWRVDGWIITICLRLANAPAIRVAGLNRRQRLQRSEVGASGGGRRRSSGLAARGRASATEGRRRSREMDRRRSPPDAPRGGTGAACISSFLRGSGYGAPSVIDRNPDGRAGRSPAAPTRRCLLDLHAARQSCWTWRCAIEGIELGEVQGSRPRLLRLHMRDPTRDADSRGQHLKVRRGSSSMVSGARRAV